MRAAVFLLVWAAGVATLAPGIPHGDSGETAAVALRLGLSHPPGYPIPTMVSSLFARFIPAGNPAWRVSLSSLAASAMSALAAVALLRVAVPAAPRFLLGLSGLLVGLALEMWNQATTPKGSVYTMTVLLLAGMAWCVARNDGRPGGRLALLGLLLGLAAGGHYMVVAPFIPFLAFPLVMEWRRRNGRVRALAIAGVMAVLGASAYLFIPLRSPSAHPALRWAEPVTWGRFSWLVFRRQYLTIEKQQGRAGVMQSARQAGRFVAGGGPATAALALAGAALMLVRRRWWGIALTLGAAAEFAAAAFYPKLEPDALWVADGYFAPAWFAATLLAALALVEMGSSSRRWLRWAAVLSGVVAVAWSAAAGRLVSKDGNYTAHDSQRTLMATLPRNSILFIEGDAYIAPMLYGMYVDGDRPDVSVIIPIFLHFGWGIRELSEQYPGLVMRKPAPWGHIWEEVRDITGDNRDRPAFYSLTTSAGWPFNPVAVPVGLVYRLYPRGDEAARPGVERTMARWTLRGLMSENLDRREAFARVVRENYIQAFFYRGAWRQKRGETDTALGLFEMARRLGSPEGGLNAGLIWFSRGELGKAERCWRDAFERSHGRPEAAVNLALIETMKGNSDIAIELCERALRQKPDFAKAWEVMSNAWFRKGNLPQALVCMKRAAELNPAEPNYRKLVMLLSRKLEGK